MTSTTGPRLVVCTESSGAYTLEGVKREAVDAIRFLSADAVELAQSGHPGTPIALAPLAYRLYTKWLRHDPGEPTWFDRDRIVLSIGHASMLLYSALHLAGYAVTLDDLKAFRQWKSRTPGHPERGATPGVDMTTGPLGQGIANGVGFAIAERMLAARYNRPAHSVVDHRTWVIAGDGDMMEGISSEAAAIAGRLELGKLTVFYDSNRITLEGDLDVETSEDVAGRFAANGWHVTTPVGCVNDLDALDKAIAEAVDEPKRPSLVVVHSNIGFGTPKQDTAAAHGNPLGAAALAATREKLGWNHAAFDVPDQVYEHWRHLVGERAAEHRAWRDDFEAYRSEYPELAAEFTRVLAGTLPDGWTDVLPSWEPGAAVSGRAAGGVALNTLAGAIPELIGGSADVVTSTETYIAEAGDINSGDWTGSNIHFGVREHAMGAISNALAAHGGLRPFCSTFFVFTDYLRPAIRLSALMQLPVIWVVTHDSIGVGEDGPTHQPIEHLASFRAMPGLTVIRAGDANEVAAAWAAALERSGPTMIVLSRQGLQTLASLDGKGHGLARVVRDGSDVVLVGTGSELSTAYEAAALLGPRGISARVVSLPSWESLRALDAYERAEVLPPHIPTVAVEAGATQGWLEFADHIIGVDGFGASAPAQVLYRKLGLDADSVARSVEELIAGGRT